MRVNVHSPLGRVLELVGITFLWGIVNFQGGRNFDGYYCVVVLIVDVHALNVFEAAQLPLAR